MPQKNLYYQYSPSRNYDNDKEVSKTADLKLASDFCYNCGQQAKFRCAKCKMVSYCSRNCQTIHWKTMHKLKCKDYVKALSSNSSSKTKKAKLPNESCLNSNYIWPTSQSAWSYKEYEIVTEVEPKRSKGQSKKELEATNKKLLKLHKNDLDAKEVDATVHNKNLKVDQVFLEFQARIGREPEQILRYIPVYDRRLEIFVNKSDKKACGIGFGMGVFF